MSDQTPYIITDGPNQHPAAIAWSLLRPDLPKPDRIEVIRDPYTTGSAHVFKLVCEEENGYSVIGKGNDRLKASIEKAIYENIFRFLPDNGLKYYGYIESENNFAWNFMEDAKGIPFSYENPEHVLLAEDWLAELHTNVPKLDCLPELDVNYYYSCLLLAYEMITSNLSNSALKDSDKLVLKSIISDFEILRIRREKITQLYEQMPKGFIHGDFKSKNLLVRRNGQENMLIVFDWEEAGWGLPAADLFQIKLYHDSHYWLKVRNHWQDWTFKDMLQMSNLGKLLNHILYIYWKAWSLEYEWIGHTMKRMKLYEERLAETIKHID